MRCDFRCMVCGVCCVSVGYRVVCGMWCMAYELQSVNTHNTTHTHTHTDTYMYIYIYIYIYIHIFKMERQKDVTER